MARKVISVCLYVVAGFFVYMMSLLAFLNMNAIPSGSDTPGWAKLAMMGGFSIPAVVALPIGMAVRRFENWKRDLGIVLVSGAGMTAFVVFTIACLLWSPESRALFPRDTLDLFGDVTAGVSCTVLCIAAGSALIMLSRRGAERGKERP